MNNDKVSGFPKNDDDDDIFNDLRDVNKILIQSAECANEKMISEIVQHLVSAGGKRLRPLFTILSAKMLGASNHNTLLLAAAVECIHTATLMHDDVIDNGLIRRGFKTANFLWGNKRSILVGDYLFSQAFNMMVRTENLAALGVLAQASAIISNAEVTQLNFIGKVSIRFQDYFDLIRDKTAILFAAALKVGGISTNASNIETGILYDIGINFGIIFQIVDDYLDYFGDAASLGKDIGGDLAEKKITLPLILLLQNCDKEEKEYLEEILRADIKLADFEKVLNMLKKYRIDIQILDIIKHHRELYISSMNEIPDSRYKEHLFTVMSLTVQKISASY